MNDTAPVKYVWYGDDFTGASDTLATFASSGLRTVLCLGVPRADRLTALGPLDAVGIAGAARTMSPEQMIGELEPVGRYAAATQAPLLHYKCCSTFDSSPSIGSLGAAMGILKPHMKNAFVPVVGGQPSLGRYCAFGNLFAGAGQGGEIFRLDRHPTMSVHPATPTGEADLRLHLRTQGVARIGLVDWRKLGDEGTNDELNASIDAASSDAVLFDVLDEQHLARIGDIIWRRAECAPLLAIGASSVAQAVIAHWRRIGLAPARGPDLPAKPAGGPVFALAGSQSPVTARQMEVALRDGAGPFEGVRLDLSRPTSDGLDVEADARACAALLNRGRSVLAYTGPVTEGGPSRLEVAQACGNLLKRVLERVPAVSRVGIAGGDTSSISIETLGIWALGFAGLLSPGVSMTRVHADDPRLDGLELMLKGGQMGSVDVFERLAYGLSSG
jgi:3-oxoisoapionate kinase